jgi:hypothetical protein
VAASSDGVVTATVDAATASIRLAVNFAAAGSPIVSTAATTVYTVTVTEQTSGNQVRGTSSAPGGVINGIDHEAVFGYPLSYVATAYGVSGNLLATSPAAAVTLPAPAAGTNSVWLKSLSTPSQSQAVRGSRGTGGSGELQLARGITQGTIWVQGRPDPIVVSDVRRYPAGTITVRTVGDTAGQALDALLASPGPYLLQMPTVGEPDRYVTIGNVTPTVINPYAAAAKRVRLWPLPIQAVDRPAVAGWSVAIPGKTYADSQAALPLYSNRTGTYLSRSS